ncbi:MAG: imidazolonepropionase [Rhodospirillales bacterium]
MTATLYIDARLATLAGQGWGAVERGAVLVADGRIAWAGPAADAPGADRVVKCRGRWITPALIDCHTHIVFGGDRSHEFELRLKGATYEEIARAGGGILSTVKATRAASEDELAASATRRVRRLLTEGVTVVEIKSGYGLDLDNELKQLRTARRIGRELPVTVMTTCLAAHAVPPEYQDRADAYVDLVCDQIIPATAREGLADAVDAFCETIAFTPAQVERVFAAAKRHKLPIKLHAEQLSNRHGAALAARYGALSADHLEHLDEEGAMAMRQAGTVAVLLPGAFYALHETKVPPVDLLRRHGVPIAVAGDCNPGSSPAQSLLLMLNMACTLFRLTPEEALRGATVNAARALGLGREFGTLEPGKRADLALWDIERPAELAYWIGANPAAAVLRAGEIVVGAI